MFSYTYQTWYVARHMLSLSTMKITNLILQQVSQQVAYGNPWWGLVVANEYLSPTNPLHRALVCCFHKRLGSTANHNLVEKLVSGFRYAELPPDLRALIGIRVSLKARDMATGISPRRRKRSRRPIERVARRGCDLTTRFESRRRVALTRLIKFK